MSSWNCLSPFRKLLLKLVVHRNLTQWISIMRLMRELPILTSLLICFTRSISPLLLAVLVIDCHFWQLTRVIAPMMVVKKTLASVTTGLLIMLHLTRSSHGVWQMSFSTYSEKSTSMSKPRTWSALSNTSIKSLIDEVLWAYKTVLLGKHVKIRLVALSEHTMLYYFTLKHIVHST